jgi:hypothetical protein
VCLAIAILALCLVPASKWMNGIVAGQRDLETQCQLCLTAQEKLDAALLSLDDSFAERDEGGDLDALGHPDWRYRLVVTIPAGGVGRYATVCSQAWVDSDGDTLLDPDETQVQFDMIAANREWSP